jgi:TetR/AcrR family transcriptional repressor of nem operon
MPWPEDHKTRTREKIVSAAAAAFRAGGIAGVRLEDVMARAGLTHGGFYAHFASKDDLLREAVEHAGRQTVEMLSRPLAKVEAENRLPSVVDAYLSPEHLAHPEVGCPLAALGSELARTGGHARGALAAGVKDRLAWMRQLLSDDERASQSDDQIIGVLACLVGGIVLARAVDGKDSKAVLRACREFVHKAASGSGVHSPRARATTRRGPARTRPSRRSPRPRP